MDGARLKIVLVGIVMVVIGAGISLIDPFLFWRVDLPVFVGTFVIAGVAVIVIGLFRKDGRFPLKRRRLCLGAVAVAVVIVLASYATVLVTRYLEPLRESDGSVTLEIQNLPRSYYTAWDRAWLSVYAGEPIPVEDPHLIVYPIYVGWSLNSSALEGARPTVHDFGAMNASGTWFDLIVTDVKGNGVVGDGDRLKVYSQNGSFSEDTTYFMKFGVGGPIAPFYVVYGFKFSNGDFNSWIQYGPVEWAM
jgi:hypothetical protein